MIKGLWQIYITGLKNIFKLKWRMSKYDFCSFLTVHFFVCLLVFAGLYFFKSSIFFFLLLVLLTIVPYLAIGHRLQDMGKSGFGLLLYVFAFVICYFICVFCANYFLDSLKPVMDMFMPVKKCHCIMDAALKKVSNPLNDSLKYGYILSFLVFLFFAYRWFLGDGDKKANEFGKPVKQKKVIWWFMLLPLFFVTYVISFPWFSIKAIINYAPCISVDEFTGDVTNLPCKSCGVSLF